ncbi:hypothetical protein ACIP5N_21590 [Streptomyces sp. NPDC088768]|uniref:nSTAND1 domain-containing NTPase n=1 Tax=Streptomyces sp. NPDC088768 TaxID=3365894 RepID=UPI003827538B
MGRQENPIDPGAGAVQGFAHELRELRREAGAVPYRELARAAGYSAATLAAAAAGKRLPSWEVTRAYVQACGGDVEGWRERWEDARAREREQEPEPSGPCPYPGLRRFDVADEPLFFGRGRLVARLVALVRARPVVAVVGVSGSGKSSLLRAGLVPALRAGGLGSPPAALRIITPGPRPARTHAARFEAAEGTGETIVLVDQFEELFTRCHDAGERERFLALLLGACAAGSRVRVVLAVRADFFGRCAEVRDLAEALRESTLLLPALAAEELREAVVRPAQAVAVVVERALTARLVREVAEEAGALPLLAHVLRETWRRRRGRTMTMSGYEAAGGLRGAVAQSAETFYRELPAERAALLRRLLLRLVVPGEGTPDTRRVASLAELHDVPAELIEDLARARLVVLDDEGVGLVHECLLTAWPRLRSWIEEDRARLRVHRLLSEAAADWAELGRDPGALYQGVRLAEAAETFPGPAQKGELSPLEAEFLAAGLSRAGRERRRLRQFLATVSIALVLALLTTGTALWQWDAARSAQNAAEHHQRVSLSRQLAAQSRGLLTEDPDLASLLAVRSHRTAPTAEARAALDAASAVPLRARLTGGEGDSLNESALSPDGRTVAVADFGGSVRLYAARNGQLLHTIDSPARHPEIAFLSAGRLVTGGSDGALRLWDTRSGRALAVFGHHRGPLAAVAADPAGQRLATAVLGEKTVRLWDTSGRRIRELRPVRASADTVALGTDGTLATGTLDGLPITVREHDASPTGAPPPPEPVRLWDSRTGRLKARLAHPAGVRALSFDRTGSRLLSCGVDGRARLWDTRKGKTLRALVPGAEILWSAVLSPDGRTVATAENSGTLRLWSVRTGTPHATLPGHSHEVGTLAFAADGTTLVSADGGGDARLWDVTRDAVAREIQTGNPDGLAGIALSPDGKLLATTSPETPPGLWEAGTGQRHDGYVLAEDETGSLAAAFAPTGGGLAIGTPEGLVRIHHPDSRTATEHALNGALPVESLAWDADGDTLAALAAQGPVTVWDMRSTLRRPVPATAPSAMALSPDGRTLALAETGTGTAQGARGSRVRLWDIDSGTWSRTMRGTTPRVTALAFAPDGRTLAATHEDGTTRIWDSASGTPRATLPGESGQAGTLAFTPDGTTLAVAGLDGALRLWDVADARERLVLTGGPGNVIALAFSPGGHTLASAGQDGNVLLWKVTLATPDRTAQALCKAVGRDLTPKESHRYLPNESVTRVCGYRNARGRR